MCEEEASGGIVRIGVSFRVFMMNSVVAGPVINGSLKNKRDEGVRVQSENEGELPKCNRHKHDKTHLGLQSNYKASE